MTRRLALAAWFGGAASVLACGSASREGLTTGLGGAGGDAGAGGAAVTAGAAGTSTAGAAGAGSTLPNGSGLPGGELFARTALDVHLTIAQADLLELEEHGDLEQYVPASVTLESPGAAPVELGEVGVRHKGNYTLHHCWDDFEGVRSHVGECEKLSLKLKFDEYAPDARFDGLKRLNLHASSGDASKLRELVAYQTFRDFGVEAPRALPARVFVNGTLAGLFIAVEEIDGRFTAAHFPEAADGNLYKEVWPSATAPDAAFVAGLQTNEEAADVSDLRAFAEAVARTEAGAFDGELEPFADVEALLRYIAVDRALRNWDGIMAFYTPESPHNFYWYRDDGPSPRFHLIPWDMDGTFWAFDPYMHPEQWVTAPPVPDFNAAPRNCDPRPIWDIDGTEHVLPPRCDQLLDGLARNHWPRLAELGRELLAGPFAAARLDALATQWEARLAALVAEDPTLDPLAWQSATAEFHAIVAARGASYLAFLDEGLIDEPVGVDPTQPVPPDLHDATLDTGLHIGSPTNFEFGAPPGALEPAGVYSYGDPLAVFAATWSDAAPISGLADLRFDFTFSRGPEPYDEWVGLGLASPETDVRAYSKIVVWVSSDVPRALRVHVASPAYDEDFGGIFSELGMDYRVGPEAKPIVIDFARLYYPTWARDAWTEGQGFPGTDDEARDVLLRRFTGIVFGPAATVDAAGELSTPVESGYLRIDDIYFL
jgi:spore coat protein H